MVKTASYALYGLFNGIWFRAALCQPCQMEFCRMHIGWPFAKICLLNVSDCYAMHNNETHTSPNRSTRRRWAKTLLSIEHEWAGDVSVNHIALTLELSCTPYNTAETPAARTSRSLS